jgi:hypothetical protein
MRSDTTPDIRKRYRDMIMALSPEQRLIMATWMFDAAGALVVAGLENEANPDGLSPRACMFLRLYSRDFDPQERNRIVTALDRVGDTASTPIARRAHRADSGYCTKLMRTPSTFPPASSRAR